MSQESVRRTLSRIASEDIEAKVLAVPSRDQVADNIEILMSLSGLTREQIRARLISEGEDSRDVGDVVTNR